MIKIKNVSYSQNLDLNKYQNQKNYLFEFDFKSLDNGFKTEYIDGYFQNFPLE